MHSSKLRGEYFHLQWREEEVSHSDCFADFEKTARLGVVAPERVEGAGAITLIMAYVTAFYDRYRAGGEEFFAYPDFFTFQRKEPVADYGMFDIWPNHKNVFVEGGARETAAAITDRGVNVLLVPEGTRKGESYERVQIESARRNINRCFTYSPGGTVTDADLVISCEKDPLQAWALALFDSAPDDDSSRYLRRWLDGVDSGSVLQQSFAEVSLTDALERL